VHLTVGTPERGPFTPRRAEAAARTGSVGTALRPLFPGEELRGVVDVGDERLWM
jgi:hypothetical protein